METGGQDQVLRQLGLLDLLLDQFIEGMKIQRPPILGVAFCSCKVVLEGDELSLKLLIKLFQFFLFMKDVITVEHIYSCHNLTIVDVPSYVFSSLRASKTAGLLVVEKVESWWSVPVTRWR